LAKTLGLYAIVIEPSQHVFENHKNISTVE